MSLISTWRGYIEAEKNGRTESHAEEVVYHPFTLGWRRMIEDLFELIGGRSTIEAATERFYDKVLADDQLRHFFAETDMAHLRSRQVMFVSMLLAGRTYTGKHIHDAHAGSRVHGLNDAHFDLFLQHFRAALEEVGVKPENAEEVRKRLERKRGTVLEA